MTIDNAGNVGIGVVPQGNLDIDVGVDTSLGLRSQTGVIVAQYTGAPAVGNRSQIGLGYGNTYTNVSIGAVRTSDLVYGTDDFIIATKSGTADTAPTERMRIDASGNVQQATSVNGDLYHHIYNANAGTSAEATLYVSNGSTSSGLFAGATGTAFTTAGGFVQDGAHIGAGSFSAGGLSIITRASAPIRFYTNGHTNERMRIDASGNLLVGTTSGSGVSAPDNSATGIDAGVRVSGDGYIGVGIDSNPAMYLNRMGTNGDVLRFKHDGGLVGSIGTEGGDSLYIQSDGTGGAGLRFHPSTADIDPVRNRTRIDQYISLGSESARFKDLRLSGGVILDENPTIVGTTVVNRTITSKTLDDYEEGTWLPSINGLVPTTASGEYTKVGDMVHLHCYYDVDSGTAIDESGALTIKGLPFIPTNDGAVGALMADDVNMSATGKYLVVYSVPTNGGGIRIYECGDNIPWLPLQSAAVGAGTTLHFSISYKTA
jgi:hypothetical protein